MAATACSSDPADPVVVTPLLPRSAALVSAPEPLSAGGLSSLRGLRLSTGLAYVSMPPGTDSLGVTAAIRNGLLGIPVVVLMTDGGFDPIAIEAEPGDTLQIRIRHATGSDLVGYSIVPTRSRPVVVRTSPPRGKRDVSLNSIVQVVFNQPVESTSLPAALHLRLAGVDVPGSVAAVVSDGAILEASFTPASPLEPVTEYQFEISTDLQSTSGDALVAAVQVPFTTEDSAQEPPLLDFHINLPFAWIAYDETVLAGAVITPAVQITQQQGEIYNGEVTIALDANPTGATLLGATTAQMVDGVATFPDLAIDRAGDGYTLVASASGAETQPDPSVPFGVCSHDCWIRRAPMPTPRIDVGVGVVNGLLYAVGGVDPRGVPSGVVEAYDPVTDAWTAKASMPTARYGFGLGVVNGILYAFGGITLGGTTAAVEAYDPATDQWNTRTPLAAPRGFPGAGVVNGVLYSMGGQEADSTILATVQAYDPLGDHWTARAPLPEPRSHIGVAVVNGLLYAIDGLTTPVPTYGSVVRTVQTYNPDGDSWSPRTSTRDGRLLPGVGVLPDGSILVVAGADGVSYLTDGYVVVESYDETTDTWTSRKKTMWGLSLATIGEVNGVLYTVGYVTFEYRP